MAYVKQNWENLPSTNTPITAERLNHMEDGISEAWEHGGGGAGETLKIGTILPYTGSDSELPTGYMLCDGSELSRTDYSDLFAVIGTSFGVGDGSSTFNLPNLKGKVLTGLDSDDTDFASMGTTGGEKTHTLTVDEMPSHNHDFYFYHINATAVSSGNAQVFDVNNAWINTSKILNKGGNQPHNILQPYVVVNYIIKVTQSSPVQAQIVGTYTESSIDGYSCDYVNNISTEEYSTNEIRTNKVWVDGKPIYRKVVYISSLPNNTTVNISHGIVDMDEIVYLYGIMRTPSNHTTTPFNMAGISAMYSSAKLVVRADRTQITVGCDANFSSNIAYVTLEYTKTTD